MEVVGGLYRFQNPTRWFISPSEKMTQPLYESLHGRTIHVPGTGISLMCVHVEKERDRIIVHWLPPTYPREAVTAVVQALTGDGSPEVFKLKDGKWGALCHPACPIPYYAAVEVPGRRGLWHSIMITMPGRLTVPVVLQEGAGTAAEKVTTPKKDAKKNQANSRGGDREEKWRKRQQEGRSRNKLWNLLRTRHKEKRKGLHK